jgi:putative DNA primase/helicase
MTLHISNSADFSDAVPTAESLLLEAKKMTSQTPSEVIYRVLADAARLPSSPQHLLNVISLNTLMPLPGLWQQFGYLQSHFALKRSTEGEALALDALNKVYAFGLHLRVTQGRELLKFNGTHWAELSDQELRATLRRMAMEEPDSYGNSNTTVPQAMAVIRDLVPDATAGLAEMPPSIVNTLSGEIWVSKTGDLIWKIHRPESGLRYVLPVHYDPEATSPRFDKMMDEIFAPAKVPAAVIDYVLEMLGYAVQGVRNIPVILFLWGGGANGKSTLLSILQAIVGRTQVLAGSLGSLSNDRFALPNLDGKLLFIEDDAKDGEKVNDGLLKKISENKVIDTRRVRSSHGISFCSMVMPIIAINGAPAIEDTSAGMRRRLHVIPFDRRFKPEEVDLNLAQSIKESELSGVLNQLLAGLSRLRARGKFAPPADCERAKEAFLSASNSLHAFLNERCLSAPGKPIRITDLYQAYAAWMRDQGQRPAFPARSLGTRLKALGYVVRKSNYVVVDDLMLKPKGS